MRCVSVTGGGGEREWGVALDSLMAQHTQRIRLHGFSDLTSHVVVVSLGAEYAKRMLPPPPLPPSSSIVHLGAPGIMRPLTQTGYTERGSRVDPPDRGGTERGSRVGEGGGGWKLQLKL